MKAFLLIASLAILLSAPGHAQQNEDTAEAAPAPTAEEVDAAVTAINALAEDENKLNAYCAILDAEDALAEGDTAAADAVANTFDVFLDSLSADAQLAFDLDETLDPTTPEAQRLGGAFLSLEDACAGPADAEEAEAGDGQSDDDGADETAPTPGKR